MSLVLASSEGFPKSHRLLRGRDFLFRPYTRFQTKYFSFIFTPRGQGRIGISLSKKILRRATARNRVRRLIRESFRKNRDLLPQIDLHILGQTALKEDWESLGLHDVQSQFQAFIENVSQRRKS